MNSKYRTYGILILFFALSCQRESTDSNKTQENVKMNIRYIQSHDNETLDDAITSFKWAMSFLGAMLPSENFDEAVSLYDQNKFTVDFSQLGFSKEALKEIKGLVTIMKESEEYEVNGAIDLGRFIVLTLNSSHHYYAITGAEKSLDEFLLNKEFDSREVAILQSGVSFGNRIIRIPNHNEISKMAFLSHEGSGSLKDGSFQIKEYEVVEIMPNGQSRFAIYDENGNLLTAGLDQFSASGKPSKCIWCHETNIQKNYVDSDSLDGYITPVEFNSMTEKWNASLDSMRNTLNTALEFSKQKEHELMEIIYISFMEPSAERLALEWNMDVNEIGNLLQNSKTHIHAEFPFLGELYDRHEIEQLAPYTSLEVPTDARESSIFEPNYLSQ